MGAKYGELKKERDDAVKAMEGFCSKLSLKPGDLVVFKVDPKSIGTSFGTGWGFMDNLSNMLTKLAGGAIRCLATTDRNPFDVTSLDGTGRAKLRALLDQLDALAVKAGGIGAAEVALGRRAVATPR